MPYGMHCSHVAVAHTTCQMAYDRMLSNKSDFDIGLLGLSGSTKEL